MFFDSHDIYTRKQWRQVQYLANVFWPRWIREYLPQLQQRQKWHCTQTHLSINDMVIVCDYSMPHTNWLLGRVLETFSDDSGLVRNTRIRTKHSILLRPIPKLVYLCFDGNVDDSHDQPNLSKHNSNVCDLFMLCLFNKRMQVNI